ncbi:MAG: hypothetical protein FJ126_05880 [Deltaproteobacteria bacterium]|nr:hypothetical protein [Deltaproteobacteria bacterium]
MCMNIRRSCRCGRNSAYFLLGDNLLPPEVLVNLYCPGCRDLADGNPAAMLEDCGWILEFDLAMARIFLDKRGISQPSTPEFIFDKGYLTWQGFSPGDHEANTRLHQRLAPLIEENLNLYLQTLKSEWLAHVAALKAAGWRKALTA